MPKKPAKPLLSLYQVSKEYLLEGERVLAVDNVSFDIFPGEFVAITGPSGSGKSTLLHLMSLLDTPTAGQIRLDGRDVSRLNDRDAAILRNRFLGFVFQQFNLLPRTSALDNVLLPALYANDLSPQTQTRARQLLTQLGLGERLANLSNQLSGGQQQRVAIARALINDPKIIFADEPTGNLDSRSGQEVIEILKSLHRQGRTIVLVTHDLALAKLAPRRLTMRDGLIVQS